ncbi:mannose-1-phosphate guanylyltransferase/mannose-6-phosphate isomerase [Echinimonas agarilytica]|uniref:mannose-1-phosphate guanylyltransferase n=1 Tax=Echinimonas agarilytica TaxID=1215918 RepID=A0AA42B952_9GAMM|nr:mannose-1-phosphate guanylyltransferase/mannose-6-phosphate isomerase [Echinimonas agarilytica]MCM2681218.1 mannose-1-phosphate guanylyltransferase/mannose-6-phosphate isomerase [Echinimonas agarilytica]
MIPVILSGGSGSRLWPLSRKLQPKQFINLVSDSSLMQDTLSRLPQDNLSAPVIVCNEAHRFMVREQLQDMGVTANSVILEPYGRNTAPAVAIAAFQVLESVGDETMLVLPADHVIREHEEFHAALQLAETAAEKGQLVLFGITPNAPETGYGYVKSDSNEIMQSVFGVDRFVEKPDKETAQGYLESGDYFWNSGMFMFRPSVFLEQLALHAPDIYDTSKLAFERKAKDLEFWRIDEGTFAFCPDESIDIAVMEQTDKAVVVPLDAGWNDVGSWSSLWAERDKDDNGNVAIGDTQIIDTHNCYAHSTNRLVSMIGVEDVVVVETKDAVMVLNKNKVQDVKKAVKSLEAQHRKEFSQHRTVYQPWGNYDDVDKGEHFRVRKLTVEPNQCSSLHRHFHRSEHWIVVRGCAEVTIENDTYLLSENESTYIAVGQYHRISNPGSIPLEMIEVQSGSALTEQDIQRIDDRYGRVSTPAETPNTQLLNHKVEN